MSPLIRTAFLGLGRCLPERVVTNNDLSQWMDTTDDWIVDRTGIRERRWVSEDCGGSDLGAEAAREACDRAGVPLAEVDCIIVATLSSDHAFPGTACFMQAKLDLPGVPALDIRNQCSGFLYGLSVADAWIRCGTYRRVLLVGAEVHSTGLDISTEGRDLACLFGDGAGAVLLGPAEEDGSDRGVLSVHLHADGHHAKDLWIEAPSSRTVPQRITPEMLAEGKQFPKMRNRRVFTSAVQKMPEVIHEALAHNKIGLEQIKLVVPHQANQRITEAVAKQLGLSDEIMFSNIEYLGNTTAASIPLALYDAEKQGRIKAGDLIMLAAFGAGFTWGASLLRW